MINLTQEAAAQISNKYSEYIAKLPGVINANVVFNEADIEEVHVLADMSRTPKQIGRDIQSLFMAQFQKDIDHRVISVAQIESGLNPKKKISAAPRLVIEAVTLAKKREQTDIEVSLSLDDKMFSGKISGLKSSYDVFRGIAQATLNAIAVSSEEPQTYTLLDVRFTDMAGERMAIVCVSASSNNATSRYSGTSFSLGDDSIAIVKATLSAVNRRISYC